MAKKKLKVTEYCIDLEVWRANNASILELAHPTIKEWEHSGKRCVILQAATHYNGYVGISKKHPLYKVDYSSPAKILTEKTEWLLTQPAGKRGIIPLVLAGYKLKEGISPELYFNVHGSITYSGRMRTSQNPEYKTLWWFGYDTAHAGDTVEICNVDFCTEECNSLAEQLTELETNG